MCDEYQQSHPHRRHKKLGENSNMHPLIDFSPNNVDFIYFIEISNIVYILKLLIRIFINEHPNRHTFIGSMMWGLHEILRPADNNVWLKEI